MKRASPLRPVLLVALLVAANVRAQTNLPKDSPFMPTAGASVGAVPTNESLELAGISSTGKNTLVCIYDTQAKRSLWIPVNSTIEGIKVLSFDAAHDQATITIGGVQKILRLRKSTVAASANAATAAAGFAVPAPATPTQGIPQPPPAPGSVAQQETEARMLVSDLLEIGIQQRKAYEEAQKKAEQEKTAGKKG